MLVFSNSCFKKRINSDSMQQEIAIPVDLKVLMNHIYEYKKGVRCLVLYTFNRKYESFAISRLEHQNID